MAKPPVLPIDGTKDYFDLLIEQVKPFYDSIGVDLTFDGYKETVISYGKSNNNNYNEMWELSRDFHMWGEYFTEIQALTEKYFLDSETEEKKEFAIASLNADGSKVASGDRMANKAEAVVLARRNKNVLKAFLTVLEAKIDSSFKAHHHCKATCNWLSTTKGGELINT